MIATVRRVPGIRRLPRKSAATLTRDPRLLAIRVLNGHPRPRQETLTVAAVGTFLTTSCSTRVNLACVSHFQVMLAAVIGIWSVTVAGADVPPSLAAR